MKEKIIGSILEKLNCLSNQKLRFALECLYTFLTKFLTIVFISILFKTGKIVLLLIALMLPLRAFGFGLHANNNLQCWIISLIMYSLVPLIISRVFINGSILMYASFILALVIIIYAPSPTKSIPLLNKKKNQQRKIIISLIVFFYLLAIISSSNQTLKEVAALSLFYQAILVCPLAYKLLGREIKRKNQFLNHWF